MGECNGWYNTVEVLYKGSERTFVCFPGEKNVVDEPYPVNYVVGPFLASQQKTTKLDFSSQVGKQFKLSAVPFKPLRCCLRNNKLVSCHV